MAASMQISKKTLGGKLCVTGSESLLAMPYTKMLWICKRVKVKLQWKPQKIRDERNVEHLRMEATVSEQNQPKGVVMLATVCKTVGACLPKPL